MQYLAPKSLVFVFLALLSPVSVAQDSVRLLDNAEDLDSAQLLQQDGSGSVITTAIPGSSSDSWVYVQTKENNFDLVHFPKNQIQSYSVYSATTGALLESYTADELPEDFINWKPEFSLPIKRSWNQDLLLNLKFYAESDIQFELLDFASYQAMISSGMVNNGLFYGAMVLMACFAFCLYAFNNDMNAARMGVSIVLWILTILSIWGYGTEPLPFGLTAVLPYLTNQLVVSASMASVWFGVYFIKDSIGDTLAYRGMQFGFWLHFAYLVYSMLFGINWSISIYIILFSGLLNVVCSLWASLRKDKAAYFLIASTTVTSLPFISLFFAPMSQQAVLALGVAALVFVMLALIRRIAEQFHSLGLKAELANERERFLASMSHEIRTPLNGIIGFSELASQEKIEGTLKSYFTQIDRSSKMLLGIVNEVLDYAKLQADEVELTYEPMCIIETLEDVIAINQPRATENRLRLSYEIAEDMPDFITTDPYRCAQVLINLCSNAVKFTQEGKVTIQVARDEQSIVFKVNDDGTGIEASVLAGLFNPFQQANASTARKFGGTGLGLAISKQLTELLGGKLTAVSSPGEGSTFTLRIPFIPAEVPLKVAPIDTNSLKGKRVLLAEDNAVNMLLATQILQKHGLETDAAVDGRIAFEKAKENHYDFILMDMQMPELSGTEATQFIRQAGFEKPIIAMTANTSESDREACFEAGMDDYLAKPIEQQQLLSKLQQWSSIQ